MTVTREWDEQHNNFFFGGLVPKNQSDDAAPWLFYFNLKSNAS